MEETPKSLSFDDFSVKMRDKTPNYDVKINDKKELLTSLLHHNHFLFQK